MIQRLAIVGLGLLGGSVAKAARARALAKEIVAVGRRMESLAPALDSGVVDRATTDLAEGLREADFILLATPVATMESLLPTIWRCAAADALLTDVGSIKGHLVRAMERLAQEKPLAFVGAHPLAGSEQSGYSVAREDLFQGAPVILTPTEETPEWVTKRVAGFWESLGGRVTRMSPDAHDRVVAAVSHLPHLVAYALVGAVADLDSSLLAYAAGGFRDTTRIAASDARLWREIFLANREALLETLRAFRAALDELEGLLSSERGDALEAKLDRIRGVRERLS
jgi:3-phosphoshikimate 1-carboxyvinyltransferase